MELMTAVLSFIVAIGILVVIHEMGHFSVARWAGVKVLRFSIGFGRPIYQRVARNGTEWQVGWLPLGGYVKMLDEREVGPDAGPIDPKDLPHAFNRQSVGKRFAIVAAGPIANFLLAIFLFSLIYLHGGAEPVAMLGTPPSGTAAATAGLNSGERITGLRRADDDDTVPIRSWPELQWRLPALAKGQQTLTVLTRRDGGVYAHTLALTAAVDAGGNADADESSHAAADSADLATRLGLVPGGGAPSIGAVEPGSPAERAGLQVGDTVLQVQGRPVDDAGALVDQMRAHPGQAQRLSIIRGGQAQTLTVTPALIKDSKTGAITGRIGAALSVHLPMVTVSYGPWDALRQGVTRTWDISAYSVTMFGRMLTGEASLKNLSGPVTIADYAGRSARMGLEAFLSFLALVSISIGVLNLLPIPVLDGGHLLYYAVEAITGRALSDRWQSIMQRAGLLCIVALSVVALFNDLARLVHS